MAQLARQVPVPVRFQGWRSAAGPLTIGQLNIAKWLANAPQAPAALLDEVYPVPPGTTVDDVAECFGILLCRHEGLRSRYRLGNPGEQRVLAAGELSMAVFDVRGAGDPAPELLAVHRDRPFDLAVELPVRLAVGVRDGHVDTVAAVYSHMAVDFQGLVALAREFDALMRDPAARVIGEPRQQPLDRATVERQSGRRRRLDQALRHWERQVTAAPAHLYARPRVHPATGSGACGISSEAAAIALEHIAARTQVSRPTIVLAALCALLSRRTGYPTCRFAMLSANRFESSLAGYIGTLAQAMFVGVEVGTARFDELVRRCFGAVLQAGLHGTYDVYRQHECSKRIGAGRGIAPSFEPLFNSVVLDTRAFTAGEPRRAPHAAAPAHLLWVDMPPTDILLRFDLGQVDGTLVARVWSGDTGRLTRAETEALLLALERLLVAAAAGDLEHDEVVRAIALPPIERPPGWLLVDNCWVELAEVQRLLDDALAPAVARVFADVDGEPLVAYVAVTPDGPGTAEEAHDWCLAALPGRHAAMTPRRYVLCGRPPADTDDLPAWREQAVVAVGSGHGL